MVSNDLNVFVTCQQVHPATCPPAEREKPGVASTSEPSISEIDGFLASWRADIQPKFVPLLSALSASPLSPAILSCQIFSYLPVLERNVQALQAEDMCLMAVTGLEQFHHRCHVEGIGLDAIGDGPMGKVWENGDVQVVQYPANLPTTAYPMDRFPSEALFNLGEVIFLPVYDSRMNSRTPGIVAVVECMLNRHSTTDMVVAKIISSLGGIMQDLGLSLNPPSKVQEAQSEQREMTTTTTTTTGGIEQDGSFARNDKAFTSMQRSISHARFDMKT